MKYLEGLEAVEFLNNLYFHDSVLYEIQIIRRNSADKARFIIDLITNEDASEFRNCHLTFNDCYYIETKMNGGVIAISDGEMIYRASASMKSPLIEQVVQSWNSIMEIKGLFHFSFTLSSTDSEVDVVCKSVLQEFK